LDCRIPVLFAAYLILFLIILPVRSLPPEENLGLQVEWTFNTSSQFPGLSFGAGHQGCITIWDTDYDGINELLFGTRRGDSKRLWCIDASGNFEWIYPPIEENGLPGDPTSKVSIVDVDGDGIHELCLAGRGGRLHVLRPDGSVMWTWDEPDASSMMGSPQAMDVDGDGRVEFFMNTNGGLVHRVSNEGQLVWTCSPPSGRGNQGFPTICDVNRDGEYEVIWASQDFYVHCHDAQTGREKWRFNAGSNLKTQPVLVADVNEDGEYEVIVWGDAPVSSLICLDAFGNETWRWTHPRDGTNIRLCQAFGDVNGDGGLDAVLLTGDTAFGVDISGPAPETIWEINFTRWSSDGKLPDGAQANHWSSYQVIADIDGDGEQEVTWLVPYPVVTNGRTGELEGYYVNEYVAINRRQESGGIWTDVDLDGVSEFICELNGNSHPETLIYCLSMGGDFPAESPWPEFFHSAYPREFQLKQEWLTMKSAHSNSMWFPIGEMLALAIPVIILCYQRYDKIWQESGGG